MDFNFENEIILENDRVMIRPLWTADFNSLAPIATSDKTLLQYSPSPNHTPELLKGYIEKAIQEREIHFRYPFLIFDKLKNGVAGSTSFANIFNYDKRLEIGWTWIGREFQQTGLNRACKSLLLHYVFETLQFERVEFRIDERNIASRRAVEKLGAQFEGVLKSHMLMPDGFRRSTCYYSILLQDWPKIKALIFKA